MMHKSHFPKMTGLVPAQGVRADLVTVTGVCSLTLGVFDDVVQQQRVFGQALHLRHQQVLQL